VEAAAEFDDSGRRDVAEFLIWAEGFTVRESETAGVVRVLTVHKAKGLGFDVVILPDVEGQTLAQRRVGLAVQRAADRSVEWVLDMPAKLFREQDPVLRAHVAAGEADAGYEALCKFYVALTRAKRAMYVIAEPVGTSSSRNFPKLLEQTLGESWHVGERAWYAQLPSRQEARAGREALERLPESVERRARRLQSRRPSDAKAGAWLPPLFGREGSGAAEFGTQVHALFETVEWWDPEREAAWVAARRADGVDESVLAEALGCLGSPSLADLFVRFGEDTEVWRERAFEVVMDGTWLTGVFDRVLLQRDGTGRPVRAWVIDFKTDRLGGGEDAAVRALGKHAAQLSLYRRVAAILTGLPAERIRCGLVLTGQRRLVEVPFPA
jgi:ATP-dependent helicase/nuclease subunit A